MTDVVRAEENACARNSQADAMLPPPEATLVSVEEGYARWARTYDDTPNPLLALEGCCITPLLPVLDGKIVLDLACGTGRWLSRFLSLGASAFGVDLSAAMLEIARSTRGLGGYLARADCAQLPFRGEVFDFALCSFALGHVHNLEAMAQELARVMKFEAQCLLCDLHPDAYASGWRTGFRDAYGPAQIETIHRPAELVIQCFRSSGFLPSNVQSFSFRESERATFVRAGKEAIFEKACRLPALQVYDLRKSTECRM